MWTQDVAPERLAEIFHHYQQALSPEVSGKGSEGNSSWNEVSPQVRAAWSRQRGWPCSTGIDNQ
jgi:hypothetical protein